MSDDLRELADAAGDECSQGWWCQGSLCAEDCPWARLSAECELQGHPQEPGERDCWCGAVHPALDGPGE